MSALSWLPEPEWTPTNTEYHAALDWWGSTMLKTYRQSPAMAYRRFIAKDLERKKPTDAMILGSLVHVLILEPETYDDEVLVVPVKRKNAVKYKDAVIDNPLALVVTDPEDEAAKRIAESISKPQTEGARLAKALLDPAKGVAEYSYRWKDELGVPCKVRFDWLTEISTGPCMVNLKTSMDAGTEAFSKHAHNLGYPAQQAFYERGFQRMTGQLPASLLIVVHNAEPFEVSIKQPSDTFMELGRQRVRKDLQSLSEVLKSPKRGCWSAPWEVGIETLELPPWARRELDDDF